MDKTEFLKLCQQNAVKPNSVKVRCGGIEYYPVERVVWFDKNGNTQISVVLQEVKSKCVIRARLQDVEVKRWF